MAEDALVQVQLRNQFYKDSYKKVLFTLLLAFIVIALLASILGYVITHPPEPKYFATSVNGRIVPLQPLNRPNQAKAAILQWATQAAIASFTYNFVNYRSELQAASIFFTPSGWESFQQSLQSSNNLKAVIAKKLVVSSVAQGAPVILREGMATGTRYGWRIQLPVLVTYQSASEISQQRLLVTMTIIRVSTLESPRGIGIAQFVAQPLGALI